jgi:phosphatidyl-myo-inositol dimannoside synthase
VTRAVLRRVGDSVDVMTYVSEWCRNRIAPSLSPAARSRMQRLSPGVDPEVFRAGCGGAEVRAEHGIPANAPVVVCTARLVRRKGQDTLIRARPRLLEHRPDAVLLLVGDGPDRRRLQRQAAALGLGGSVVLAGGVDWREVPAYFDAGDVFAMPGRTRIGGLEAEAWGIASLEAQACGLPVVLGRAGGAPETLASPSSGQVWGPGDGDLADVLDRWLSRAVDIEGTRPRPVVVPWTWDGACQRLRELWVSR